MIRVQRGKEPDALLEVRDAELARVRRIAGGRPTAEEIGTRYQVAKEALWGAQRSKCAYCEAREQKKRNDAEHYRPKARADRRPGSTDARGYWWLAWTWENLLFACRNCNQAPAKLDQFPLDVGSEALVAEQAPPGNERPLLLDPAEDDGIDHIRFERATLGDGEQWVPRARNGSRRGAETIRVCKLDAPDRLTDYEVHVAGYVQREREVLAAAIADGDPAAVWEAWECAALRLLGPAQAYAALSYDALDCFFPEDVRRAWGLTLHRPPWEGG